LVKSYENCWVLKLLLGCTFCENFKEKKIKIPFVMSCQKLQCCQKTHFSALGVKQVIFEEIFGLPKDQ